MTMPLLRIGTRGSPLALAQAEEARARLAAAHPELAAPDAIVLVPIKTSGDRIQDRTLAEAGGKGLFTKEIEEALYEGLIDLAAHSMKDMPTTLPEGLVIGALLPRADVRDTFISRTGDTLDTLPAGSVVGTAGLRRQAQILARRPDLRVVPLRGNVQTRLEKLNAGIVDATLLAAAGLTRLGMLDRATEILEPDVMLPAVAQGAIGLEARADDAKTLSFIKALNCATTTLQVTAERAMLAALDGSCRTPIAGLAQMDDAAGLVLEGLIASPDGQTVCRDTLIGSIQDPVALGTQLGLLLRERSPETLITGA